jgi:hypothetical protein
VVRDGNSKVGAEARESRNACVLCNLETLVEIRSIDVETGNTEVCGDSEAPDVRMIGAKGEIWRLVLLGKEGNGCVAMRRRG